MVFSTTGVASELGKEPVLAYDVRSQRRTDSKEQSRQTDLIRSERRGTGKERQIYSSIRRALCTLTTKLASWLSKTDEAARRLPHLMIQLFGRSSSLYDELHAAVVGAAILSVVRSYWICLTIPNGGQAGCFNSLANDVLANRIRTALREILVV